jgi:2Fe-2S ferredoxin
LGIEGVPCAGLPPINIQRSTINNDSTIKNHELLNVLEMPKVTFIKDGKETTVEFEHGKLEYQHHGLPESFLDVAMNFGIPLEHACGGSCACTTCHLIIRNGMQNLSEEQDNELDRLDTAWDLTTSSRLGCQAVIKGDVVAEFPMYTRNYVQEGGGIQLGKSEEQNDRDKDRDGARP